MSDHSEQSDVRV